MNIKSISQQTASSLLLKVGLAFVFFYAGISSLMHPDLWVSYLPTFLSKMSDANKLLKLFAVFELGLSLWLLTGRFTRYAALCCAAVLFGIIVAQPGDLSITFRDVGLLFMALSLATISW